MEEYGKFKSAEELLRGYNELEKSFTQRCQQLAELQKQLSELPATQPAAQPQQSSGTNGAGATEPSPQQATPIGTDAASPVANGAMAVPVRVEDAPCEPHPNAASALPTVMCGGGNVSCALPNRPTTLKEASELAKKFFD